MLWNLPILEIFLYLMISIGSIIYYTSSDAFYSKLAFRFTQFNDIMLITSMITFNLMIQISADS